MIRILTGCHDGTCAEIECDGCAERYDEQDGYGVRHVAPAIAPSAATVAGWITVGNRHYCSPACVPGGAQ